MVLGMGALGADTGFALNFSGEDVARAIVIR